MKSKNKKKLFDGNSGFTIAELLVSVTVFIIVIGVAVGAFVKSLKAQKALGELMEINNNLGIVLEQIAREFRTGYFDEVAPPPTGSCPGSVTFINGQETEILGKVSYTTYSLSGASITRSSDYSGGGVLTSDNVKIENACFEVVRYGDAVAEEVQKCNPPRLIVRFRVKSKREELNLPTFYAQTTVSSRVLPREIETNPFECPT